MNIRIITFFTFIFLAPVHLHGMFVEATKTNHPQSLVNPSLYSVDSSALQKRGPETDLLSTSPEKKAKTDNPTFNVSLEEEKKAKETSFSINTADLSEIISCITITKAINNLDYIALSKLLITNDATQLTKTQKETFYEQAKERKNHIKNMCIIGYEITSQSESQEVNKKFSFDSEYENIQRISRHLYALKTLPKLTFPQFLTPNIPYDKNPTQKTTPDTALLALIKNEQEKISVCCFSFDLMSIAKALIRKKKKGITVEVITDQQEGSKENRLKVTTLLIDNGIDVLAPQNDRYEHMHHKFSLFSRNLLNKSLVCEGSFNYTDSATRRNWEFMEISDTPEKVEFFKNEFITVQSRSTKLPITQPVRRNNNNYNNIH